jgi:hypothetical protein
MKEKYKLERKIESILGLFIGFVIFAFFFLKEEHAINIYYKSSFVMNSLYPIIDSIFFGYQSSLNYLHPMRVAAVSNYAIITWWILTLLYSVVIWKYRNCIGHYPIKIFTGIFKKI